MVVDGIPNVRTCITPLKEGMVVKTQYGVTDIPFEDIKKAKENGINFNYMFFDNLFYHKCL